VLNLPCDKISIYSDKTGKLTTNQIVAMMVRVCDNIRKMESAKEAENLRFKTPGNMLKFFIQFMSWNTEAELVAREEEKCGDSGTLTTPAFLNVALSLNEDFVEEQKEKTSSLVVNIKNHFAS